METRSQTLTTEEYWSRFWRVSPPRKVDPGHHYDRELIRVFGECRRLLGSPEIRFIEIGCGNSMWLPFLARDFGWSVSGLDYTDIGCETARTNLREAGTSGQIWHRNLFEENADLSSRFDIVYSGGLVEHFDDPVPVIRRMAELLAPGGIMVTTVPNFKTIAIVVQRIVGPKMLAAHRLIDREELRRFHEEAGLATLSAEYAGFGLMIGADPDLDAAASSERRSTGSGLFRRLYQPLFFVASRAARLIRRAADGLHVVLPRRRWASPAIIYAGRRAATSR
jgi:2-polyprenyl-3-methyl-5-hydroxy-6-metoxy-1,4-benzoquinol methylase